MRLTWGPAHDQAAAEASELESVSEARTGDALAGVLFACLAGFHEVERSGALGRLRAVRRDSAAAFVCFGGAVGVAHGRGADRKRSGVQRSEKPASQALLALGAGQGSRVLRWLATT